MLRLASQSVSGAMRTLARSPNAMPPATLSATRMKSPSVTGAPPSVDFHEPEPQPVVGRLRQLDALLPRPDDRLLVQRDVSDVGLLERHRLADQRAALGLVALALDLADQLVDLRVRVAAGVEPAVARAAAVHDLGERRVGV